MPVRLADIYQEQIYGDITTVNDPANSAFIQSGIMVNNPALDAVAQRGGITATVPYWNDLDYSQEPNYSNDDPADLAVPDKVSGGHFSARNAFMNKSYAEMSLVTELQRNVGGDALEHIKNRFDVFWTRQQQKRLIAMCNGLMANNLTATDAYHTQGDMVEDLSGLSGNAAIFNKSAFIDASYQMGDQVESIRAMVVHSAIEARMVKNDEIAYIQDSAGTLVRKSYNGITVITDDGMPTSGTGADRVYTSILFGQGAFGFGGIGGGQGAAFGVGEGQPVLPSEVYRVFQAGNGSGMDAIIERKTWMMHPFGFTWLEPNANSPGGPLPEFSPTLADLARTDVWGRTLLRKQVPLVFMKSKA